MIQIYYGNGKGKTTAATGCAIRCAGCGKKVLFVQFLKNNTSSEFSVLEKLPETDVIYSHTSYRLYDNMNSGQSRQLAEAYDKLLFTDVRKCAANYNMIILDEILDVVDFGYIDESALADFLTKLKSSTEIVMTGHCLPGKLADISDYISEIKEINHPYRRGVPPREGIEF